MRVSVIIPNYNHAFFLKLRIESVLKQSYRNFEVIILDDCSNDNSRDIIETFRTEPKVQKILYNETNSGSPFRQWQKGITHATGELVWIAESDDWAEPNFLSKLVPLFANNKVGLVYCGSNWVDAEGNINGDLSTYTKGFERVGRVEIKEMVRYCSIQNVSALLIRKNLIEKNLRGAERFRSCGDWFFYINALSECDITFIPDKLNNFRYYHNNTSQASEKNGNWVKEGLRILRNSAAYKATYTLAELYLLARLWRSKIRGSVLAGSLRIRVMYFTTILIFLSKHIAFRLKLLR